MIPGTDMKYFIEANILMKKFFLSNLNAWAYLPYTQRFIERVKNVIFFLFF